MRNGDPNPLAESQIPSWEGRRPLGAGGAQSRAERLAELKALLRGAARTPAGRRFAKYLYRVTEERLRGPIDVLGIVLYSLNVRLSVKIGDRAGFMQDVERMLKAWFEWLQRAGALRAIYVGARGGGRCGAVRADVEIEGRAFTFIFQAAEGGVRTRLGFYSELKPPSAPPY